MKKIFVILLFFVAIGLSAEKPFVQCTKNLDAYVGTWQYTNNDITFEITLKKVRENSSLADGECLVGDYYYQKNGNVISTIEAIPNICDNSTTEIIYASNAVLLNKEEPSITCDSVKPNHLHVVIKDKFYNKIMGNWKIDLLSPNTIKWWCDTIYYGMYRSEEDLIEYNQTSLPENIVLQKVITAEKNINNSGLKPSLPEN